MALAFLSKVEHTALEDVGVRSAFSRDSTSGATTRAAAHFRAALTPAPRVRSSLLGFRS